MLQGTGANHGTVLPPDNPTKVVTPSPLLQQPKSAASFIAPQGKKKPIETLPLYHSWIGDLQSGVLRNKWGKRFKGAIGINPNLSKHEIFGHLNDTRQELLKQIGLEFNEFGDVVVGHVVIEKYISLFLTQHTQ